MGYAMSPERDADEITMLRRKLASLEAEISQLRQSTESRFRRMIDNTPFMVWMSGPDALCNYFNPAWLEYRGRRLEEELGNGWIDGLHPEDRDLCIETYLKSFSTRQAFRMQYRLRKGTGEYSWVEGSGTPIFNEAGEYTGFVGCGVDIGERYRVMFTPDPEAVRMVLSLTERERQILVLIANGKTTKQAAEDLGISYKTADSHRSRLLEKLRVHETASMVRYAIRAGLIQA